MAYRWPWVLKCYTACQRPTLLPTTTMVSVYFIKVPRAPADLLLVGKELSQSWQHWADMILLGLGPTWAMAGKGAAPAPFSGTEAGCWRLIQGATQGGFVLPPGEDPGLHSVCPSGEGMRPFWSTKLFHFWGNKYIFMDSRGNLSELGYCGSAVFKKDVEKKCSLINPLEKNECDQTPRKHDLWGQAKRHGVVSSRDKESGERSEGGS